MTIIIAFLYALVLPWMLFPLNVHAQSSSASQQPVLIDGMDALPSRQELLNRLASERKLLVVYAAGSQEDETVLRNAIEGSSWGRWRTNLVIRHASEVTSRDLSTSSVLLVGHPSSNPHLTTLPSSIPLTFHDQGFEFFGKQYTHPQDVITLLFPNPLNNQYPLYIVTGVTEGAIPGALDTRLRNLDYQILRADHRLRIGNFSQQIGQRWQHDPALDEDFEDDVVLVSTTEHFRFYAHNTAPEPSLLSEIIMERERVLKHVLRVADTNYSPEKPIHYFLYPSVEEKAIVTNNMNVAHVNERDQSVHVAIAPGIRGDQLNRESQVIMRTLFGRGSLPVFEDGLSILASENWFGQPYQNWMSRIAHAGLTRTAEDLLDNTSYNQMSLLLRDPMAAAFVQCMMDEWGSDHFMGHYNSWTPGADELVVIEQVWTACTAAHSDAYTTLPPPDKINVATTFQKGFNFAHEGYSIVDGYGSKAADESQDRLASMGVNAVSIIPYTGMRDPQYPVPLRFASSAHDENDGAVAHAARYAQSLGFTVMLKPQIWLRGSWPGDLKMLSEEEWDRFFAYYEQWIGHYALLAELFEIDILCIGTELTYATLNHEDRWIDMARRLRSIYSGKLVYAPNWGEEFENLNFWDAFDYIGLNSYYPLSDKEEPTEEELKAGARSIVERMKKVQKKFNKPLIITEIGYPSTEKPWMLPYQEGRQSEANVEHQALCYRIMLEALSDQDWLAGVYWWKWPSYLERGGSAHRDRFTPNGKPAADVVASWFRGI